MNKQSLDIVEAQDDVTKINTVEEVADEPPPQTASKLKQNTSPSKDDEAVLFDKCNVVLKEDCFGQYYDHDGVCYSIKRFTWSNKNKIKVQVINYGARVISIKLPDRTGSIEDIILGFDDLAGYINYRKFYFGATVGRISNLVKHSNFSLGNERYFVTANYGNHHVRGGKYGFDQVVWDTYTSGNKVIMSHLSRHLTEGYPGDLLVRVTFELSAKNEFRIDIEAQTTQPTVVDISNILYFNLAGHHTGPDEIYKHVLTLNCNCFTPQVNGIPTGEIANVLNTEFDFQVPKVLGKVMGIRPKDGFYQNLCVNRGIYQDNCFVSRVLHPPSGRMIEIYSNQPAVCLNTVNDFGYGIILSIQEIEVSSCSKNDNILNEDRVSSLERLLSLHNKIHHEVLMTLDLDKENDFEEIQDLIKKVKLYKIIDVDSPQEKFVLTPLQVEYVTKALKITCEGEYNGECSELRSIFEIILKCADQVQDTEDITKTNVTDNVEDEQTEIQDKDIKDVKSASKQDNEIVKSPSSKSQIGKSKEKPNQHKTHELNDIPLWYKNTDKIVGKGRATYKMHGALSLETQKYPNSCNFKNFPNCSLMPGEVYKHSVVYKFWVRAGNPNKWIKKNLSEPRSKQSFR